jgi:hypothetical protein
MIPSSACPPWQHADQSGTCRECVEAQPSVTPRYGARSRPNLHRLRRCLPRGVDGRPDAAVHPSTSTVLTSARRRARWHRGARAPMSKFSALRSRLARRPARNAGRSASGTRENMSTAASAPPPANAAPRHVRPLSRGLTSPQLKAGGALAFRRAKPNGGLRMSYTINRKIDGVSFEEAVSRTAPR